MVQEKVILRLIFFFLALTFLNNPKLYSQTENLPKFDPKPIHFGFTLGTNFANFKYEFSPNFYYGDSLLEVQIKKYPGITLGAIVDLHMGKYFDLRAIPSLVLTERTIIYKFKPDLFIDKNIESIFAEIPLLLKFKSVRHGNIRFYVIGGAKFGFDFSSNAGTNRDPNDPIVAIHPWNYSYEFGCGLDMYFYYFKFSPEIKLSKGINNIFDPYEDVYNNIFNKFYSNFIFISFHFEG